MQMLTHQPAEANWISDFGAWPAADVWVKAMEEESILHPGMSLVKALVGYQSGEVSIKINESVKWKNVGCSCLKSNIWNEFLGTTNLEKLPNLIIHLAIFTTKASILQSGNGTFFFWIVQIAVQPT